MQRRSNLYVQPHLVMALQSVLLIGLILLLAACANQEKQGLEVKKDEWISQSYAPTPVKKKPSNLVQLPESPRFRNEILQGQIKRGMYLDEALATIRAKPYGTLEQKGAYWCETRPVKICHDQCPNCEAMLFGQNQIVMLEGFGQQITVKDFYPKRFADFRASVDQSAFPFAQQIYQREIVKGMPAGIVQMLINLGGYQTRYFCDGATTPDSESCLGRCNQCKVELKHRSSAVANKIIFLETHANRQTVAHISEE